MPTISVNNVSFKYGDGAAVIRGVSLDVAPGTFVGIVGPNGSGKSTLLRLMTGMFPPGSGTIKFNGKNLSGISRIEIARVIGYLPQAVVSAFRFSVEEVVLMGRYPHLGAFGFESEQDRRIAKEAMEATRTAEFAARAFNELSGGERQRALIASVIAQQPEFFILDEPTAALDLHHQVAIYELLADQVSSGLGVVVVTHDLNIAAQFCDRLVLLVDGSIAAEGKPDDVVTANNIHEIYGKDVVVGTNPQTKTPMVLPVRRRPGVSSQADSKKDSREGEKQS